MEEDNKCLRYHFFFGIRVMMYYDDHNPPHFHVDQNGQKYIEMN